jgi:soluble cytochrome b562
MQRMLAMLEQRFRKMLAAQVDILEATERLDSVAAADRTRNDEIEAGRQSRREMELGDEARKALELLKQDGTAVAFPEAVRQLIEDMDQTAAWLGEAKVGELTQALEKDIVASLEEMIGAREKAQKELEEKDEEKQDEPQESEGGGGEPAEPPLVDNLAELKMVRSLQMWVNRRTQLYQARLEAELNPDDASDLQEGMTKLAERQDRIFRTTRDIAQGKNQ